MELANTNTAPTYSAAPCPALAPASPREALPCSDTHQPQRRANQVADSKEAASLKSPPPFFFFFPGTGGLCSRALLSSPKRTFSEPAGQRLLGQGCSQSWWPPASQHLLTLFCWGYHGLRNESAAPLARLRAIPSRTSGFGDVDALMHKAELRCCVLQSALSTARRPPGIGTEPPRTRSSHVLCVVLMVKVSCSAGSLSICSPSPSSTKPPPWLRKPAHSTLCNPLNTPRSSSPKGEGRKQQFGLCTPHALLLKSSQTPWDCMGTGCHLGLFWGQSTAAAPRQKQGWEARVPTESIF